MNVSDNQKRWLVFGIVLNKVLVTQIRSFVEQEVKKEYGNLQTIHNIHTQTSAGRLQRWHTALRYENINSNDALPRLRGGRYDYSKFDCSVMSHVDLAKLYVENHMAKFNAFDEHCDASAVLTLLGKVPVFRAAVQIAAGDVKQARNAWAHCVFSNWDLLRFQQSFAEMEQLVKALGLPSGDEDVLLKELNDWERKGAILCTNATIDPDLVKAVQQDVNALKNDVDKLGFEEEVNKEELQKTLQDAVTDLEELRKRVLKMEQEQQVLKLDQSSLSAKVNATQDQISKLKSEQQDAQQHATYLEESLDTRVTTVEQEQDDIKQNQSSLFEKVNTIQDQIGDLQLEQEDVQRRVTYLEDQQSSAKTQISYEFASCEADIAFFAERRDPDTRKWFFEDFHKWFSDPGDSRAYVLLGDAGVGKSVMAGVLTQRMRGAGNLGAAYFCRHNDGTRNNPRYLLGTIAYQLCECNTQYESVVGGEGGITKLLGNCELGVQELFTKLLLEPLAKCNPCHQRKLVVLDALDETKYESREDFLDLIMNRFPMLPQWLVFFITSRPEDTVQLTLDQYHPCVKICAGNSENIAFYQQHEQDIKLFLEKRVDFSRLPYSAEDIVKKCNGLFLYAFCVARILKDSAHSGKIDQLSDLFRGDINNFLKTNFKRVFNTLGKNLYKKLFGCAIVAPSPLPISFIPFILQRENSYIDEQEVIDALSTFMVLRTYDQTFAFLHNLIPSWLTDKKKASPKLFVDSNNESKYFRDIIAEFLSATIVRHQGENPPFIEADLSEYCFRFGVRVLCGHRDKDSLKIVFTCLTSYKFIRKRIEDKGIEIYSVINDFMLSLSCHEFTGKENEILQEICAVLENSLHILVECPNLLHCCFRNFASKAVQKKLHLPDGDSSTRMECMLLTNPIWKIFPFLSTVTALSPDKKLIAGRDKQSIILFDAATLNEIQGPIYVEEMKDLLLEREDAHYLSAAHHARISYLTVPKGVELWPLEFSPDGKFLFFGRLDKGFSVYQGCVKKFPQFAGNCRFYKWGSSIFDGRYIVVQGDYHVIGNHHLSCLVSIFCLWAAQELDEMQGSDVVSWCDPDKLDEKLLELRESDLKAVKHLLSVLKRKQDVEWCSRLKDRIHYDDRGENTKGQVLSKSLCSECYEFEQCYQERTLALIRQRVIDLYHVIFEYQMWNVESGRPALEEAFYPDVELSPFSFLCHLTTPLEWKETLFSFIEKTPSLYSVALINALYYLSYHRDVTDFEYFLPGSFTLDSFFVKNTPVEFQNRPRNVRDARVSLDRNWIAVTDHKKKRKVYLFDKRNYSEQFDYGRLVYVINGVEHFAFMEDGSVFLYYTQDKWLHAIRLQTRTKLFSASGLDPFFHPLKRQAGYLFVFAQGKEVIEFLKYLPSSLRSLLLFQSSKSLLQTTFISAGTVLSALFRGIPTRTDDVVSFAKVKNFVFSQDSNLVAIHQGFRIGVFDCGKFLYSLCAHDHECDESYLAFSPDSTLLLCYINTRRFYVWDVQNRAFSTSFASPSRLLSIDCCCLSSDNVKLVICGGFTIEIWEYAAPPCRLIARVETNVFSSRVDKFTYCTVSPEHNLLAFCVTDRIVLCPLNTPTDQFIRPLPRAHLGEIEFCQFLKGSRYVISYGIDSTVFLWDLHEWRPITFAKIAKGWKGIVSVCMSHEEDEVVCLTSDGVLVALILCGIRCCEHCRRQ